MSPQPNLSREKWGRVLVAIAFVIVAAAVVVALPLFGARPFALVPLLIGALLASIGGALVPGPAPWSRASFRKVSKWAVVVIVVAAGWMISYFINVQIDVTQMQVNTLADESLQVSRAVDVDVRIVSFLPEGERAAVELGALLARYTAVNGRVQAEPRSLRRAADIEVARGLGVAALLPLGGPNVVVIAAAGQPVSVRFDAGLPNQEEQITNALRQATTTKADVRAYVMAGHGEPALRDSGPLGFSRLREALQGRGIELVSLPLVVVGGHIPADARLLVVAPSSSPLSLAESEALTTFIDGGGNAVLLLEPDLPMPWQQAAAAKFGVTVLDDVIVDESPFSSLLGGADTATGSTQLGHAINRPLAGALTHFARATALTSAPMGEIESVAVISTGDEASAPKTNAHGPLPLVIAADGHKKPLGRVVVVADCSFVQNAGIGLGANRDLAINSILWLAQDEAFITLRPRQKTGALIFLSPSSREALAFVLVFLIPVWFAAAARALSALRR